MSVCKNCSVYQEHKEKCWYYWDGKKECSKFQRTRQDSPSYKHADDK